MDPAVAHGNGPTADKNAARPVLDAPRDPLADIASFLSPDSRRAFLEAGASLQARVVRLAAKLRARGHSHSSAAIFAWVQATDPARGPRRAVAGRRAPRT